MPPSPTRAHSVDLWLCGHHYRASLAALSAAGALTEFVGDAGSEFFRETGTRAPAPAPAAA